MQPDSGDPESPGQDLRQSQEALDGRAELRCERVDAHDPGVEGHEERPCGGSGNPDECAARAKVGEHVLWLEAGRGEQQVSGAPPSGVLFRQRA